MDRGLFISFEGGEGSGKTTQIERLDNHLRERGIDTLITREPGGTDLAEAIREILLDPKLDPDGLSELFLFEAARHDHVTRVIRPALEAGTTVLCDRFADSSVVYQGHVRGVGVDVVDGLNARATGDLKPDITLVLEIDPRAGLDRAMSRNSDKNNGQDRIDKQPLDFHVAVSEGFAQLSEREPARVKLIRADGTPDEVFSRILATLPDGFR